MEEAGRIELKKNNTGKLVRKKKSADAIFLQKDMRVKPF